MKILVVGGGGREHAIVWKLSQSPRVDKIYCAPGNGGIEQLAECAPVKATDISGMIAFAKEKDVDFTVIAPDDPLVAGMADIFAEAGLRAFGPSRAAAEIEGSKVFAKDLMKNYNIPTAAYETFDDAGVAVEYLKGSKYPTVIKAEGLALGKGVIIAQDFDEAKDAIAQIMLDKKFGTSGNRVVIEEFLVGREVTVLAFTDGETIRLMPASQDHKKALDGDKGLNTGGMGVFGPSPFYTEEIHNECMDSVFLPTVRAMNEMGRKFKGVLYFGLIMTADGVKVIEYNCRFGDPETQVVLPLLKTDLLDIFEAIVDERLSEVDIEWTDEKAVCVVMASGGYPEKYSTGYEIMGLEDTAALVFHAGTSRHSGKILTNGGRVLNVVGVSGTLEDARAKAYEGVSGISFEGVHYRKDIYSV